MLKVKNSQWLPWVGAMAMFMQSLDGTILNTALPSIAQILHRSPLEMHSVIIAYTLTLALLIPLSGWLSDKLGSRNVFITAVAIFTIGSLACALSTSLNMLILSRILQAIGGSMMVPVSRLVLLYTYPKNQLLKIINFVTIPGLVGPVIGPTLGGWLVEVASWHWIFLINIPIGIAGIFLSWKIVPNYKREKDKFDFIGLFLFGAGLVLLSLSLEFGGDQVYNVWEIVIIFLIGLLLLVLYVIYSQHTYSPLINLDIFKIRTLRIGIIGNLATRLGVGGVPLMLPLMLQLAFNRKPSTAGMMLIFSAITSIIARSWVVPLVKYFGYRKLLISNTVLLGITITLFALPSKDSSLFWLIPILVVYGAVNSIQMASMNSIALADLVAKNASNGNTMLSVTQQLSISFGISVSAMILRGFDTSKMFEDVSFSFKATFITLGVITMLSSFVFRKLKSSDGDEMSGAKH